MVALSLQTLGIYLVVSLLLVLALATIAMSIIRIGPNEVGLVIKRWGREKKSSDGPVSHHGEAGYQADLLMPGWRFRLWPIYAVAKYPWVQVPAGEIGVVIAQVGEPLPIGAKSAEYRAEFGDFRDVREFLAQGGQKGVQRHNRAWRQYWALNTLLSAVVDEGTHVRELPEFAFVDA